MSFLLQFAWKNHDSFNFLADQENVAFFGYHQAVGICEGHPFLVADSGLQSIEAFRSNDGLALSLRPHGKSRTKKWVVYQWLCARCQWVKICICQWTILKVERKARAHWNDFILISVVVVQVPAISSVPLAYPKPGLPVWLKPHMELIAHVGMSMESLWKLALSENLQPRAAASPRVIFLTKSYTASSLLQGLHRIRRLRLLSPQLHQTFQTLWELLLKKEMDAVCWVIKGAWNTVSSQSTLSNC